MVSALCWPFLWGISFAWKRQCCIAGCACCNTKKQFLLKTKKRTPCRIFRLCLFPLFFSFFLAFFPVDKPPFPRIAQSPPGSRVAMKLEFILYIMFIFGLFLFCFCFLLFFKSFFQVTTYGVSSQKKLTFDVICR